jgi:hypothetical protein
LCHTVSKKMSHHRYILEPYNGMNSRYHCPKCKPRNKTFSLYIDTETGEHVHHSVGRCNRESKCGYHYPPKQYFQNNNISFETPQPTGFKPRPIPPPPKPVSFIPVKVFRASLKGHEENNFVKFLIKVFGVEVTSDLISKYFIATSKLWNGATVFWQIDTHGKVRTGKIMLYNPSTGKRVKEPYDRISWAHTALKQPEFELKQCLFGEHLLIDKTKPVAIVESEKTAVIASVYFPQFIWLAVGGLSNLNPEKCSVLKGRIVILFPDLNGFDKWSKKAKELSGLAIFTVSDLLERKANETEKQQGFDLADYLVKMDVKDFIKPKATEPIEIPAVQRLVEVKSFEQPDLNSYFTEPLLPELENWDQDIIELESYFSGITIPTQPVKLNQYSTIKDCSLFIKSHLATVKANNGKPTYLPYLNRLQELKQVLNTNLN